eukprot:gene22024-28118_t
MAARQYMIDPYFNSLSGQAAHEDSLMTPILEYVPPSQVIEETPECETSYLNVHSGVSMGLMAGIDVSSHDRSEYLILGQPLTDVATAEGDALAGDLVISPSAHDILHPPPTASMTDMLNGAMVEGVHSPNSAAGGSFSFPEAVNISKLKRTCSCVLTKSNFFLMKNTYAGHLDAAVMFSASCASDEYGNSFSSMRSEESSVNPSIGPVSTVNKEAAESAVEEGGVTLATRSETSIAFESIKESIKDQYASELETIAQLSEARLTRMSSIKLSNKNGSMDSGVSDTNYGNIASSMLAASSSVDFLASSSSNMSGSGSTEQSLNNSSSTNNINNLTVSTKFANNSCSIDENQLLSPLSGLLSPQTNNLMSPTTNENNPALSALTQTSNTDTMLHEHFMEWIQPCLCDDIARHVHEASRTDYIFTNSTRTNVLRDFISSQVVVTRNARRANRGRGVITTPNDSLVKKLRNEVFTSHSVVNNSKAYSGELRSICVMFINIDMKESNSLYVDSTSASHTETAEEHRKHEHKKRDSLSEISNTKLAFHFLHRTELERQRDNAMSNHLANATSEEFNPIYSSLSMSVDFQNAQMSPAGKHSSGVQNPHLKAKNNSSNSNTSTSQYTKVKSRIQQALNRSCSLTKLNVRANETPVVMQGRRAETSQLLRFILPEKIRLDNQCITHFLALDTNITSNTITARNLELTNLIIGTPTGMAEATASNVFSLQGTAKFVVIEGVNGIGKSQFAESVLQKVSAMGKANSRFNTMVFSSHATSSNKTMIFYVWKSILTSVLAEIGRVFVKLRNISLDSLETDNNNNNNNNKAKFNSRERIKAAYIRYGTDHVLSFLSPEMQALKPLLSFINVMGALDAREGVATFLGGQDKLDKCVEIIVCILQQFPVITGKAVILYMSDIQFIDSLSLQVLNRLWVLNMPITVVSTCHSAHSVAEASHDHSAFGHSSMSVHSLFTSMSESVDAKHRYLLLEIGPLSDEETKGLICDIFAVTLDEEKESPAERTMFTRIHNMSGGNPLYIVEIAKTMINNLTAAEFSHSEKSSPCVTPRGLFISPRVNTINNSTSTIDTEAKTTSHHNRLLVLNKALQGVDFHINRIDEIICYRFDQLDSMAQYFVKVASVACSHSNAFTLSMITFMMNDQHSVSEKAHSPHHSHSPHGHGHSKSEPMMHVTPMNTNKTAAADIAWILFSILKSNEFIRITTRTTDAIQTGKISAPFIEMDNTGSGKYSQNDEGNDDVKKITPTSRGRTASAEFKSSLALHESEFDASSLEMLEFEFSVALEQTTIYDLMLADQKASLHSRMAAFLQQEHHEITQNTNAERAVSVADLFEEGHHWKLGGKYSNAMSCYYRSSVMLEQLGSPADQVAHLYLAYNCLKCMRSDAGIIVDDDYKPTEFPSLFKETQHTAHAHSPHHGSAHHSLYHSGPESSAHMISRKASAGTIKYGAAVTTKLQSEMRRADVYKIFKGDSSRLEVGLNVLMRLGRLATDVNITSRLFDEALQLIILTNTTRNRRGSMLSSQSSFILDHESLMEGHAESKTKEPSEAKELSRATHKFNVLNPKICFPILSSIIMMFRTRRLADDESKTKETAITDLYLKMSSNSEEFRAFYLVALCMLRAQYIEKRKVAEMFAVIAEMKELYHVEEHSAELTQYYLVDLVPHTLVNNSQILDLAGCVTESHNEIQHQVSVLIPNITHLNSLGLAAITLASLLINSNDQKHMGFELCNHYLDVEQRGGVHGIFKELFVLYREWALMAMQNDTPILSINSSSGSGKLLPPISSKNSSPTNNSNNSSEKNSIFTNNTTSTQSNINNLTCDISLVASIMNGTYMNTHQDRQYMYLGLTFFLPEYVCACICLLQAETMLTNNKMVVPAEHRESVRKYCEKACEYNDKVETFSRLSPVHIISLYACFLLKVRLLMLLLQCRENDAEYTYTCKKQAIDLLNTCTNAALGLNHFSIVLQAGIYFEIYNLDTAYGVTLQTKAVYSLTLINGEQVTAVLLRQLAVKYQCGVEVYQQQLKRLTQSGKQKSSKR